MAIPPAPAAMTPPASDTGAMGGAPDPSAGGDNVIVTICKNDDGSYTVYSGDEPDADGDDMSGDDAGAMGSAGDATAAPTAQGQPADSVGAALKIALDLLNADKSSEGAPGNADDQLAAGFSASQSPTPASGPAQKY